MRMKVRALFLLLISLSVLPGQIKPQGAKAYLSYSLAFASFAPLNTDIFVADADGSNPKPLLANPALDYNASFSLDGKWVIFTSDRNGSADIYRVHPNGTGLERLIDNPAFDDQASLSPDGKSLAFVSSRSGQADIWILELRTKKLRNLTNNPAGDFRPSWSPDGQWLAFTSDRDSTKPKGNGGFETMHSTEIYITRRDGSGLKRITRTQSFAGSPRWSPDEKQLVFYETDIAEVRKIVSPRELGGTTQIATIDLESSDLGVKTVGEGGKLSPSFLRDGSLAYVSGSTDGGIEFTNGTKGSRGEFNCPAWSNDGRHMVFHREVNHDWPPFQKWHSRDVRFKLVRMGIFPSFSPSEGRIISNDKTAGILHNSILLMNADGSRRSVLFTETERSTLAPAWSPRGDKIAFAIGSFFQTTLGPAIADIAIMNSDGTSLKILTKGDGNYGFPSWSPDERQIVFRAGSKDKGGLFIIDIETEKTKVLTTNNHDNFPSWSPAGNLIAFTSYRDGDYEIYTIKPDGTDLRRLTNSPGNDAHNSFSTDGRWIAFSSARGGFKDEAILHPHNPQPYGDIYVMRADGSDVRMLTDNQFEDATPSWIPERRKR